MAHSKRKKPKRHSALPGQPFFWKWWWIGVMRKIRFPPVRLK